MTIQIKRDGNLIHLIHPNFYIQVTEEADFCALLVEAQISDAAINVADSGGVIPMEDGITLEIRWANFPERPWDEYAETDE